MDKNTGQRQSFEILGNWDKKGRRSLAIVVLALVSLLSLFAFSRVLASEGDYSYEMATYGQFGYTPNCLKNCQLPVVFNLSTGVAFNKANFGSYIQETRRDKLVSVEGWIGRWGKFSQTEFSHYDKICGEDISDNLTNYENCSLVPVYAEVEYDGWNVTKLEDMGAFQFEPDTNYLFLLTGEIALDTWVDVVPIVQGVSLTEFAIWNSTDRSDYLWYELSDITFNGSVPKHGDGLADSKDDANRYYHRTHSAWTIAAAYVSNSLKQQGWNFSILQPAGPTTGFSLSQINTSKETTLLVTMAFDTAHLPATAGWAVNKYNPPTGEKFFFGVDTATSQTNYTYSISGGGKVITLPIANVTFEEHMYHVNGTHGNYYINGRFIVSHSNPQLENFSYYNTGQENTWVSTIIAWDGSPSDRPGGNIPTISYIKFNQSSYRSDEDVTVSALVLDNDTNNLTVNFTWTNITHQLYVKSFTDQVNGTIVNATLGSANTTSGDTINVSVRVSDGDTLVEGHNSTTITTATESEGRTAIESGISASTASSGTLYTGQQVYIRYLNGTQKLGTFDKVLVEGSQRWLFNYKTTGESYTNMNNIAPVIYVWENASLTNAQITAQVSAFINSTNN